MVEAAIMWKAAVLVVVPDWALVSLMSGSDPERRKAAEAGR